MDYEPRLFVKLGAHKILEALQESCYDFHKLTIDIV